MYDINNNSAEVPQATPEDALIETSTQRLKAIDSNVYYLDNSHPNVMAGFAELRDEQRATDAQVIEFPTAPSPGAHVGETVVSPFINSQYQDELRGIIEAIHDQKAA